MLGQLEQGDLIFLEYEVIDLAGVGATSFVYKCRATKADMPDVVAVKVLHNKFVFDRTARAQFLQEAELMRGLGHEHVVQLFEVIDMPGQVAFVMEHIDGPTLQTWQARSATTRTDKELCSLFVDVLKGLSHAHAHGVIHRDLKPANIMIDESGDRPRAKIIDFGVARRTADGPSEADFGAIRGTVAYISPDEIRSPHEVCESSDLYSLGVMLYEVAAGTRPFTNRSPKDLMTAHLNEEPMPPRFHNPDVNPELEQVILRSLAKRPKQRYRTAHCLQSALEQAGSLANDIRECQQTRPTLPAPTPELRAWARSQWMPRATTLFARVVDWFCNPGLTGGSTDPHYLARPHVEFLAL